MQNPIVQQVVETIRGANNVLITVKNSPSVDELTAAIALTLILNHMNKHATTVFSGRVPSTIEFLQPEMAIESSTDSLRDFIIALDKSKADKLRYKVEDNVVRIFITPYRSSISEEDLEFSQGDFNVDVVVALGVLNNNEFDQAVLSHGRILHDATVVAINNQEIPNEVGAVSWQDQQASSISEMIATIADLFGADVVDSQIATALMTGIVSETDRFKNEKTTPQVLSVSSMLMSAGANQQLIAEKLEHGDDSVQPLTDIAQDIGNAPDSPTAPATDDVLSVAHDDAIEAGKINIDDQGNINTFDATGGDEGAQSAFPARDIPQGQFEPQQVEPQASDDEEAPSGSDRAYLTTPLTAQKSSGESGLSEPTGLFGSSMHDVASQKNQDSSQHQVLSHAQKTIEPMQPDSEKDSTQKDEIHESPVVAPTSSSVPAPYEPPASTEKSEPAQKEITSDSGADQTLEDIEKAVHSPHLTEEGAKVDAEEKVDDFLGSAKKPEQSAQGPAELPSLPEMPAPASDSEALKEKSVSVPPAVPPPAPVGNLTEADKKDAANEAAPKVPPPMMPTMPQASSDQPQFYESDGSKSNPFLNPKK